MFQMYESKALPLKNMPNMGNLDVHWIEEEIESQYMNKTFNGILFDHWKTSGENCDELHTFNIVFTNTIIDNYGGFNY